jgi:hypothetical protein
MHMQFVNGDVNREHRRDLERRAQHHRLVRLALESHRPTAGLPGLAMAWLGRRLIIWGESLQARYDRPQRVPQPAP